ncbi:histone-lysine N-methyltransferase SETMAR [Trichonephila clavipes]|nr:histone-lysine N-methyltransferase SETMAR [Trichonephila clavipes]
MEVNKEKIRYILQFFSDKGENATKATEIVNGVYNVENVRGNYVQFWFRLFRSGIFEVKDVPRTGRPVVENVEVIQVDRHVSSRSIAQKLKIEHKTVLNNMCKVGLKRSSMLGCHIN